MKGPLYWADSTYNVGPIQSSSIIPTPSAIWTGIYIRRWRTSFDCMMGVVADGIPLPLMVIVPEEGVDYPFYTRGVDPQIPVRRKKRRIPLTDEMPIPIFESINPNDLLFFASPTEMPLGQLRKRKFNQGRIARESFARPFIQPPLPAGAYVRTLCQVLEEIQRHLLEPIVDGGNTWQLWTKSEVVAAFNRRMTRFIEETGITRLRVDIPTIINEPNYLLPSNTLSMRRMTWDPGSHSGEVTLVPTDEAQLESNIGWETATGPPTAYIQRELSFRLYPFPTSPGTLHITIVPLPAPLNDCDNLPIPSVFAPFVKWGTIADLLRKEGEANDPERAKYAEGRYQEGVELGRLLLGTDI